MKKCLITGGAGLIGVALIDQLLNKNYEITVMDLKSISATKRLEKYKDKINIVYADINDKTIIKALVKDHDIIFHLAGILPYTTDVNANLAHIVDYEGSKNIIDSIKELNPKAYLIFPSTTTIYGNNKIVNEESDINIYNNDFYSQNKYKIEKYIESNLENYIIYRIPLVIYKEGFNHIMYNIPKNYNLEVITDKLVAKAFEKTLKNLRKLNKKIFILSGGKKYRTNTNKLLINVLKINGVGFRYFIMKMFLPQNFYTHYYDTTKLNDILDYQTGSINDVYKEYEKLKKFKRCLNRLLAYNIIRKLSKDK